FLCSSHLAVGRGLAALCFQLDAWLISCASALHWPPEPQPYLSATPRTFPTPSPLASDAPPSPPSLNKLIFDCAKSSMESKPCLANPIEASSMYPALGNLLVSELVMFSPSARPAANGSNHPPPSSAPFWPKGSTAPERYFAGFTGLPFRHVS